MYFFYFYNKHPSAGEKLPRDLGGLPYIGRKVKKTENRKHLYSPHQSASDWCGHEM